MKIFTERTLNEAYLIIEEDDIKTDEYDFETRMLTENMINGILPLKTKFYDEKKRYYYSVRGKVSLANRYEGRELRSDELAGLIGGLSDCISRCEEYLIRQEHLLLDPQNVYIDSELGTLWLCVYPHSESSFREELMLLSEYMITNTDHNEKLAIDLAYGFYRQVTEGDYRFDDLLLLMKKREDENIVREPSSRDAYPQMERKYKNNTGKSILILIVVTIVIFCLALCLLMLYFR